MHPVDALPDADAFAGLLIAFVLEQQACREKQRGETLSGLVGGVDDGASGRGLDKEASVTLGEETAIDNSVATAFEEEQKFHS